MKSSFVFDTKYDGQIALLTDEQAGVLFRAIRAYQAEKELPEMDEITNIVFVIMRQEMDEEKQKKQMLSLVRKEAGSKGGRPSKCLINKNKAPLLNNNSRALKINLFCPFKSVIHSHRIS